MPPGFKEGDLRSHRAAGAATSHRRDHEAELSSVLEFMRKLWALDHALQLRSKRMVVALNVTGPQRLVIRLVGRNPGILARDLAAVMHIDKSTLASLLVRLERAGLVRRDVDRNDRRRAPLRLTAKGARVDGALKGTVESAVGRAMRRSQPRDLRVVSEFIAVLTEMLLGSP
jgi:MarR family transcriptional regulator, organic hydroperoxide resistance regulator